MAAAAAAAVVSISTFATPALAAATDETPFQIGDGVNACPGNRICFWNDANFHQGDGKGGDFASFETDKDLPDMGKLVEVDPFHDKGMQDATSSVLNKTGTAWCLYADNNFSGEHVQIDPGQQIPDLGQVQPNINDLLSSAQMGKC
jgi:hypothetical protein